MKKLSKILAIVLCVALTFTLFAGCGGDKSLTKVNVGIHANEGGASLFGIAKEKGFFEEFGIDANVTIVESGPSEMAAMRADKRTLDVGYIGAGVAWNPIDGTGNSLDFIFLDCLSNSEMLLARDGFITDTNSDGKYSNDEIFEGLKGKKVYMQVGTTPGGWFLSFVSELNKGKAEADQVWLSCEDPSYLADYKAPNTNAANKISVINYDNANLAAGMSSADAKNRIDIAVGFAPATTTILKNNKDIKEIATTVSHIPTQAFPSTWVASTTWIKENPETAQSFVNALYKAACYRAENDTQLQESMRAGEKVSQKPDGTFDSSAMVVAPKAELDGWFKDTSSLGYTYMKALYDSKVGGVPDKAKVRSFEDAFNDDLLLDAIKNVK